MANAAYWFRHDTNAKDDYKLMLVIDQLGMEGYGIFWILIETLREQEGYRYPMSMLPILAKRYNTSGEKMKTVVTQYGLFEVEGDDTFISPALARRMGVYDRIVEQKRLAGSAGGRKKADNRGKQMHGTCVADANHVLEDSIAGAQHTDSTPLPSGEDRNREDGSVEDLNGFEQKSSKPTDSSGDARTIVGRSDGDVYERVGKHTITVGAIRGFLNQKFTQSEIDDVVDGLMIYQGLDAVNNIGAFMGSWLRKRRDDPKPVPGKRQHGIPCRLFTSQEIDQLKLNNQASIVRIEGLSACRSARDKPVLLALNSDIERYSLESREPKIYGTEWPD
jgi:hypothetical protein